MIAACITFNLPVCSVILFRVKRSDGTNQGASAKLVLERSFKCSLKEENVNIAKYVTRRWTGAPDNVAYDLSDPGT